MSQLTPANQEQKTIVDVVSDKVKNLIARQELQLPAGYSAGNALKQAYLVLRETVDRNQKPALEVCTKESIASALLETVVLGLYPAHKHCYYIVYGNKLQCQRSYMGNIMLAKRLNPDIAEINAEIIYQGDDLEYEIIRGKKIISRHRQNITNMIPDNIIGAYAMAVTHPGEIKNTALMLMHEIEQSWKQSKQCPFLDNGEIKKDSVHGKFKGEMCKRTVLNRLCKTLINTSADNSYLGQVIREQEAVPVEAELTEEIETNANQIPLQFDTPEEPERPATAGPEEDPFDAVEPGF